MALDIGRKRTGIAVTDSLQLIANGLTTVPTFKLIDFLSNYFSSETVDRLVVGYPRQMNNLPSEAVRFINPVLRQIEKNFPELPIELVDERFTSALAHRAMIDGGMKKSDRKNKAIVDTISATIILQSYMEARSYGR